MPRASIEGPKFVELNMIVEEGGDVGEDDRETTMPIVILNPIDNIRSFNPRKGGRVGTRIAFSNGNGIPVKETFDEVREKLGMVTRN